MLRLGACLILAANAWAQDDPWVYEQAASIREYYGPITCARFLAGGSKILSGGKDKQLILWDANSGKILRRMRAHKDWVLGLAVNRDETRAASVGRDGQVIVWDLSSGGTVHTFAASEGNIFNFPMAVAFHPKEKRLAVGMRDGRVIEYDLDKGEQSLEFQANKALVWALEYLPDGQHIVTTGWEQAKIFRLDDRQCIATLGGHNNADVTALALDPKGNFLATAGQDALIQVWSLRDARRPRIAALKGHQAGILAMAFDPTGQILASGGSDFVIHLWNVRGGTLEARLDGHKLSVHALAFNTDGSVLLSTSLDSTMRLWSVPKRAPLKTLQGHGGFMYHLAYTRDGGRLAAAGVEFHLKMWDTNTWKLDKTLLQNWSDALFRIAFHPTDPGKLAIGYKDGSVKVWNWHTETVLADIVAHVENVGALAWVDHGRYLVSGGQESYLRVWDMTKEGGQLVQTLGLNGTVHYVAAHPTEPVFAACDQGGMIYLWQVDAKLLKGRGVPQVIDAHADAVTCVGFNPEGTRLVSSSKDGRIKVWDVRTRKLLHEFRDHAGEVKMVAFHPDGNYIASAGVDKTVRIWNLMEKKCAQVLEGYEDEVWCLTYNARGDELATGTWDGEIKIWKRAPRREK